MHVGHCQRAPCLRRYSYNKFTEILMAIKLYKEYYVNDYGEQIKNFVQSVYYRILEIKENKKFPDR